MIVSTRHYRAPEVILELGWAQPCDVWSIGKTDGNGILGMESLAKNQTRIGIIGPYKFVELFLYSLPSISQRGRYTKKILLSIIDNGRLLKTKPIMPK